MRVEVYKHWPKSRKAGVSVYAVRDITAGSPDYGRVVAHSIGLSLLDATFTVQPAGNRKVRDTGVKNVHAFIRGTWLGGKWADRSLMDEYTNPRVVRYNPRTQTSFMALGVPIHKADIVVLANTVSAWDKTGGK